MKAKQKLVEAVDSLYYRGCVSTEAYTRVLLDCYRCNDVNQARRVQCHMDLHLYQPKSTFLHNRLLHLYAKSGKLSDARRLFEKMPHRDIFSYNAMLSALSNLGSVDDLWSFFQGMAHCDSVSYNVVISTLVSKGCPSRALKVFIRMQQEGFEPTGYTHVGALNACSRSQDLRCGKQIHGRIVACNLEGNAFVLNALTDMYAKCGELDQARWLFDRMTNKNVISWNSMISGYLKNGMPEKCIGLFRDMQLQGLEPDQFTVSNVIAAFFQRGYVDEAEKTFSEIEEKDEVCWTTMIVGYAQNGKEEDALMVFGDMLLENIRPDSFTISSVVNSCARLASLYHGRAVHGKAVHMGVDFELLVSSALIDMYGKCGETKDAWVVFKMMPAKNVVSWNSMIIGYAQNGKDHEALALYEEMLRGKLKPDNITFIGVLSACVHAGLSEQGHRYFHSISKIHGMTPTMDHYACMVSLLGRSGHVDKAVGLIQSMPYEPNCLIWSTLLSVCTIKGDLKYGEIAARHLFDLDPLNAGPYIMLSNIYAACRRWKDVASVRSLMKGRMVKKFAAYSWVEIDGKVHKFVSEDRTHLEVEKIYEKLDTLVRKLLENGFSPDTKLVLHDVGEEEKLESVSYHSEKLALAYWLIRKPQEGAPMRIMKNIRVCGDCHTFMKLVSKILGRAIVLRDSNRFHHFCGGQCSCKDLW